MDKPDKTGDEDRSFYQSWNVKAFNRRPNRVLKLYGRFSGDIICADEYPSVFGLQSSTVRENGPLNSWQNLKN